MSKDSDPKSPKYLVWNLQRHEADTIKDAIGELEDNFPLLSTFSDFYEDFECHSDRLLAFSQETVDLEIILEEHHRETPTLLKILTLMGGLAAMGHDYNLSLYGYSE